MNTGFFFLFAWARTTSVQCTLVSMVWTGLSTISSTPTAAARWNTTSASSTSSATRGALAAESTVYLKSGRSLRWRMFSIDPVERSSRACTRWPRAISSSARCDPMNPAPPVIRYRIGRTLEDTWARATLSPMPRVLHLGPLHSFHLHRWAEIAREAGYEPHLGGLALRGMEAVDFGDVAASVHTAPGLRPPLGT